MAEAVDQRFVADPPQRLVGDKAYDSDRLDEQMLSEYGTEVIAPHRNGRRPDTRTQDGRSLRRYRKRWKVERFFAWLNNYRASWCVGNITPKITSASFTSPASSSSCAIYEMGSSFLGGVRGSYLGRLLGTAPTLPNARDES